MINGVINIYKEKGFTSHDVVAKLRGILKQKKIGHTGTLDPDAEGVLPVCLGTATRLCDMLTDHEKEYVADFLLGYQTDTQDMTGTVLCERPVVADEDMVRKAILSFLGKSEQIPPMYSALKVNGKKLYELARQGVEVERVPRPIEIKELEILKLEIPRVTIRVVCSKGTYIRTLCHDIGEKLGCGAAMSSLVRTRVGKFGISEARRLSEVEMLRDAEKLLTEVIRVDDIFKEYPEINVKREFQKKIDNGNAFDVEHVVNQEVWKQSEDTMVRVYNEDKVFYGIFRYNSLEKHFTPYKMFLDRT